MSSFSPPPKPHDVNNGFHIGEAGRCTQVPTGVTQHQCAVNAAHLHTLLCVYAPADKRLATSYPLCALSSESWAVLPRAPVPQGFNNIYGGRAAAHEKRKRDTKRAKQPAQDPWQPDSKTLDLKQCGHGKEINF